MTTLIFTQLLNSVIHFNGGSFIPKGGHRPCKCIPICFLSFLFKFIKIYNFLFLIGSREVIQICYRSNSFLLSFLLFFIFLCFIRIYNFPSLMAQGSLSKFIMEPIFFFFFFLFYIYYIYFHQNLQFSIFGDSRELIQICLRMLLLLFAHWRWTSKLILL